mmetsp:Transcript_53309/g.173321  ORF Transcript_53309/g.173321 Transcript_53309/m.173321 type:complete len:169 (+) Transcript_53309:330-836(+)
MTGVVDVLGTELQDLEEEEQWVSTTLAQLLKVTRDAHECVRSSSSTDTARLAGWHWSSVVSLKQALERLLAPSKVIGRPAKQEQPIPRLFLLSEDADTTVREALEEARADGAQQLVFVLGDHKGFGCGPATMRSPPFDQQRQQVKCTSHVRRSHSGRRHFLLRSASRS